MNPFAKIKDVAALHPANAVPPTFVTEAPSVKDLALLQFSKALLPIVVKLPLITTSVFKLTHSANEYAPIVSNEFGNTIESAPLQL